MPRADEIPDLSLYATTASVDAKFDTSTGHDHDGSDSVKLPEAIYDYGVSAATSTARALKSLNICYGRYTLGGNNSVAITNLPFSSASSYYVIVSYGSTVTDLTYACSVDRDSGSQFTIYNSDGVTRYIFWFAIGI